MMHVNPEQQATGKDFLPEQLTMLAKDIIKLLQFVANHPNTDPELLRELAAYDFAKILEGIASNPNTPTDVLLDLGAKFPGQLLNNPVFFLLILENPNLLKEMPWQTRNKLYDYKGCPEPLRSQLQAAGGDIPF